MNCLLQASLPGVKLTHAYITLKFKRGVPVCESNNGRVRKEVADS